MKRVLFFAIAFAAIFQSAFAYDFSGVSLDGQTLYFNINDSNVTVTFPAYSGNPWFGYTEPTGVLYIPSSVTYCGVTYTVTRIGDWAFCGCTDLPTIVIPSSVSHIGYRALNEIHSVYFYSETPPNLGGYSFGDHPDHYFHIPCGSYNSYYSYFPSSYRDDLYEPSANIELTVLSNALDEGEASIQFRHNRYVQCDSTAIIQATAYNGYHFDHWSNGNTSNPDTLYLVGDSIVTAFFSPNQLMLTLQSDNPEHGTVYGGGNYLYQDTANISAIATEHYHFVHWSDGDTDNPRQYVITDNDTLIAYFAIDTHTVNVTSSDIARGRVEGGGEFEYGTPCTVSAEAYSGYHFDHWSNGSTYNPYTFAVMEDTELTAVFLAEGEVGIEGIENDGIHIYSANGRIIVEGTTEEVRVFDMVGRKVRNEALPAGVYMVKIGARSARKVVVMR